MVDVAAALVALVLGFALLGRTRMLDRSGEPQVSPSAISASSVSIVVPARDERTSLPVLLMSIRDLDVAPLEVIVVDDGSSDGTAEIAASMAATVIAATVPPPGWLGKSWACWTGAQRARGSHLLFLDADVRLARDALQRLCTTHVGGLLSVQPFHRTRRRYESLSGFFNLVSMMGSGAFAFGRRHDAAIAFGPCLLTSAADYRAVDGHRSVRGAIVEDAALAARYAAHGLPVRCFAGDDAVSFRMYPDGLRSLVDGWTRSLAAGSSAAQRVPVGAAVAWVAACGAVAARAAASVVTGDALPFALYPISAASIGLLQARVGSFRWWSWALYPVPFVCFVAVCVRSLWSTHVRREVVWRSRRVRVGQR